MKGRTIKPHDCETFSVLTIMVELNLSLRDLLNEREEKDRERVREINNTNKTNKVYNVFS